MLVATACPLADLVFMKGLRAKFDARGSGSIGDEENPMWFC